MDLVQSLIRPSEAVALVQFKSKYGSTKRGSRRTDEIDENFQFCNDMLFKTSRSFAMVIADLGAELRDAICVFYLVLRGLDTVEDDMEFDVERKKAMLPEFYTYLNDRDWRFSGCGKGDELLLLADFQFVVRAFQSLHSRYQEVISDITNRMGEGMCEYINKSRVTTLQEWDTYCYFVAGLVGIGLTKLFSLSGLEEESIASAEAEAISMGLFLQKTNIIRDYLEDIIEGRIFWPEEVWSRYAERLDDLRHQENSKAAIQCLNHLITNALAHIPDCLEYLNKIQDAQNFAFCAIPQVMAMATLSLCYNNPDVFTQKVKIRRGESARIVVAIGESNDANVLGVHALFYEYASALGEKIPSDDPNAANTRALIEKVKSLTLAGHETHTPQSDKTAWTLTVTGAIAVATTVSFLF